MPSETKKFDPVLSPQGIWSAFQWEGEDHYRIMGEFTLREKTVMELCNRPFVLRFDLPSEERTYYVGYDEELWKRLQEEGKAVRGLWELFEGLRQRLVDMGLPAETSIYRWSVGSLRAHLAALETFTGSKVEVRPTTEDFAIEKIEK